MEQHATQIFHVPDMSCEGCVRAITRAVQGLDAQAGVSTDLVTHLVRIASGRPAAELEAAIRDAGFSPAPG